jgi:hypothetical protein
MELTRNIVEQLRVEGKTLPYDKIQLIISTFVLRLFKRGMYRPYKIPEQLTVHRARSMGNKKRFASVVDLGPTLPEGTTRYRRCHQPNRPMCYYSLYPDTALAEIKAKVGKRYTISTFAMPKGSSVIPIGELDFFRRTGRTYIGNDTPGSLKFYQEAMAKEDWPQCALFDAFIADEFIKRATSHGAYNVTSAFSTALLKSRPRGSAPVDAIIYPSVAFREGMNFAALPEMHKAKMSLVKDQTKIIKITDVLGYGIFDWKPIDTLKSVDTDGRLNWESAR